MRESRPYNRRASLAAVAVRGEQAGKPLELGPGDPRYVAACIKLGGFASAARTETGRLVFVWAGQSWMQP